MEFIPEPVRFFIGNRLAELTGLLAMVAVGASALSLLTWSVLDPSLDHATAGQIHNLLGRPGAIVADLVTQILGLGSVAMLVPLAFWGWRLLVHRRLGSIRRRLAFWLLGTLLVTAFAALLPVTDRWPLPTGLGGVLGDGIVAIPRKLFSDNRLVAIILVPLFAISALLSMTAASGFILSEDEEVEDDAPAERKEASSARDEDTSGEPGFALVALGAVYHLFMRVRTSISRFVSSKPRHPETLTSMRPEPRFDENSQLRAPVRRTATAVAAPDADDFDSINSEDEDERPQPVAKRVVPPAPAAKTGKRIAREAQPSLLAGPGYELPQLTLLSEARKQAVGKISEDALEQNARLLEGVLDDFGVKGEIIKVRPGPVVTLYELEPAPGIKSSRVISLADDIARSMSALSARVAVVQGRNAIGVELPNQKRETVFLRELLASEDFEKSKHKLPIALGKSIGGEPIIVDLARMPHLLVAGTTGSGKSVAINTMILSLLYRLTPAQCRLIMVDPKMLELSIYDGIPHLLTPVVTDPKKAVVALKWAVREMEDRYKKMSKVGVRNIDGFNARVAEAAAKGEIIRRTVQTGYDRETGEAVYEQEDMDLSVLPYIVVIVDEMADLMMVAGKDIEGAIQRLAQMARAAGIHLIMATQRPSVDVITGTIKANFPTRISFQVTSKIDSRTILGEQGAEQLLGQGDMLYMAGGGRISRVHGPFVSDAEVEKIVGYLKTQGQPDYLESITSEEEDAAASANPGDAGGMDAEEGGDLYDRAVAIVLRDRKCSTSYIQRRLSVGYNKAASLVERMEQEGVVAPANHSGKREILVGGGVDRGAFELTD
jgi:S-DNA-T family DNA segregation ATPase FtsK/SpoIIIE